MWGEDNFEITLRGIGGHATRPHSGNEVLVTACELVTNLQTIVARRLDPADIAVVSVTELITDGTRSALPGTARILGNPRSFRSDVSADIENQMRVIAEGTALAYNVESHVRYTRKFITLDDPEFEETIRWCGSHFDPEWFDLAMTDKDLRNALRSNARRRLYQPKPKAVSNK